MADLDYEREAIEVANLIEAVCRDRYTASVYMAISMVLGSAAAQAGKPDFDAMMALVKKAARATFDKSLREKARG